MSDAAHVTVEPAALLAQYRAACDEADCLAKASDACKCHGRRLGDWWPADRLCTECRARFGRGEVESELADELEQRMIREGVICRDEGCMEPPAQDGRCAIHLQATCEACGEQLDEGELAQGIHDACVREAAGW